MAVGWVFVFGSAIGSFLNVVIYRLPAGESLSHPGSRCPKCRHSIRTYDNIPILSWLILRGRCRDCRAPISGRYPLVEAFVAVMFVSLALAGPLNGEVDTPSNWGQYAYHMTALCVLFSAALIHYDGKPLPRTLIVFAMVVGLLGVLIWPDFPERAVYGAILGAILGATARPAARGVARNHPNDSIWSMLIVGLFFGWHGVAMIAIAVAIADLLIGLAALHIPGVATIPRSGAGFVATLAVGLTSNRPGLLIVGWLHGDVLLMLSAIVVTVICSLIARRFLSLSF